MSQSALNRSSNKKKLIYADLTYKLRGAIFNVYNELGFGHKEQVYQKALAKELTALKIPYECEPKLSVNYKGDAVGNYRPDLLVDRKIILELKAVEFLPKLFEIQLLQYLKITHISLGFLVNFGSPRLYIKRLIFTKDAKRHNPRESVNKNQRKSLSI